MAAGVGRGEAHPRVSVRELGGMFIASSLPGSHWPSVSLFPGGSSFSFLICKVGTVITYFSGVFLSVLRTEPIFSFILLHLCPSFEI